MEQDSIKKLKRMMLLLYPLTFVILAGILMLTAGTLNYWPGWIFCALVIIPALFISLYFIKRSPEFLERRMKFKEKEIKQKTIIKFSSIFFIIGFIMPGLDYRFGWSMMPVWLIITAEVIILACYYLIFLAFKENAYAGRTVEIFTGQKVIDTGPYAIVRHPMYSGIIPMFLFLPLALGSFWAIIPFIPVAGIIIVRILNEEAVLKQGLPGYQAYCEKVRYRLVPYIW